MMPDVLGVSENSSGAMWQTTAFHFGDKDVGHICLSS